VALAGCGSDSDDSASSTDDAATASTEAPTSTTETTAATEAATDCGPMDPDAVAKVFSFDNAEYSEDGSDGFGGVVNAEFTYTRCEYSIGDQFASPAPTECPKMAVDWMTSTTNDGAETAPDQLLGLARTMFDSMAEQYAGTDPAGEGVFVEDLTAVGPNAFYVKDTTLMVPVSYGWAAGDGTTVRVVATDPCSDVAPDKEAIGSVLTLATVASPN